MSPNGKDIERVVKWIVDREMLYDSWKLSLFRSAYESQHHFVA